MDTKINGNTFKDVFVIKKTDGKYIEHQYYAPNVGLVKVMWLTKEGKETTDDRYIYLELISADIK